jgi:type IV pilus assembly protein PilO
MDLNELNNLELSNIAEWPLPAKIFVILFLCGVLGFAWYYFDTRDQLDQLKGARAEELTLRQSFESKQKKSANLEAYEEQLVEMRDSLGAMLRQLPDKNEVAGLLVEVSQTGLASGLEFQLFKPSGEIKKEFYAELPILIRVTGLYHEFGAFISGLASLPRIVTIHPVSIRTMGQPSKEGEAGQLLVLETTVKTYRYLEEEEQ